ncbi:hypothetical protein [Variovorax sp. KBS0712]|uniref:hypothetical protein n=1 Tax=Variovorax sp. KBS0712 TaxID=2578111 RepID=UPI0028C4211E|nr:hypothetical protein [Variovorax sp. KBS0712]
MVVGQAQCEVGRFVDTEAGHDPRRAVGARAAGHGEGVDPQAVAQRHAATIGRHHAPGGAGHPVARRERGGGRQHVERDGGAGGEAARKNEDGEVVHGRKRSIGV